MYLLSESLAFSNVFPCADRMLPGRANRDQFLRREELGQFNNDHKIKVKLANGKKGKCTNVYAKSCWLLGKELYTDLIVGNHPETGEEVQSWHIRGKGFPTDAIKYHCKHHGVTPGELAQRIFDQDFLKPNENKDGELIDCLCDGNRHSFEHTIQKGQFDFVAKWYGR